MLFISKHLLLGFFKEQTRITLIKIHSKFGHIQIKKIKIIQMSYEWGYVYKSESAKLAVNSHTYERKDFKIYNKFHVDNFILFLWACLHETLVNSNWFEISLRDKISLRCEITSLSAFTWLRVEWNSLRCKFHFGQIDRSKISNRSEFSM